MGSVCSTLPSKADVPHEPRGSITHSPHAPIKLMTYVINLATMWNCTWCSVLARTERSSGIILWIRIEAKASNHVTLSFISQHLDLGGEKLWKEIKTKVKSVVGGSGKCMRDLWRFALQVKDDRGRFVSKQFDHGPSVGTLCRSNYQATLKHTSIFSFKKPLILHSWKSGPASSSVIWPASKNTSGVICHAYCNQ